MCGIVGAIAQRDIIDILLEGLQRLEYRGYDSSGVAVINNQHELQHHRKVGKVQELINTIKKDTVTGGLGIAHTRWATHGHPTEYNAHPHVSGTIALVHNGIIENYQPFKQQLIQKGYKFNSSTDSEVIVHLIHEACQAGHSLLDAVKIIIPKLKGAYGLVVIDTRESDKLIAARSGSPLVIGCGIGENFVASDPLALSPVTHRFIYLEEGDIAQITRKTITIFDQAGYQVVRAERESHATIDSQDKGTFRHYMQKEIYEQPIAIQKTLENRLSAQGVTLKELDHNGENLLLHVENIQIIACGTSYNAGLVAKYWFESIAKIPCDVEIASEFRYREPALRKNCLLITISQSGETADTLAALHLSKQMKYLGSLAICNNAESSLVRESDLVILTQAGVEIGVASTKAFTTQLTVLLLLLTQLSTIKNRNTETEKRLIEALRLLPSRIEQMLAFDFEIEKIAEYFTNKQHALFLGRGTQYPIAMEAALKLKEISYIHAEAYAAGELKHGPLALIDEDMPVIVIAPNNDLLEKLKSNIEEVKARGGQLFVFCDKDISFTPHDNMHIIALPHVEDIIAPICYSIPMQLLSYYVALIKGTDVDQPRNLAKSVTVE